MDLKITKRNSNFLFYLSKPIQFFLLLSLIFSCSQSSDVKEDISDESEPETVIKRRDDGTISSVNQVNAYNMVHGIRTTYYEDGKTHIDHAGGQ